VHLHYFDRQRLPEAIEKDLDVAFHPTVEDMVKVCDVVTSTHHCILRPRTCLMIPCSPK
jgi:formate dehydrogenase